MKSSLKLFAGFLVMIALVGLTACGEQKQVQVQQKEKEAIVWKLAMTWPTNFPIFGDAVLKMADMVKEMSNGEMEIRIDSKNKHKAPLGVLVSESRPTP